MIGGSDEDSSFPRLLLVFMNRKKIKFIEPKFILRKLDLGFLKQAQEMSPLFLTHEAKVKKAHTLLDSPISDHARPGILKS